MNQHIRNIAIIAHVDHGKTTLVDGMLKQAGIFRSHEHVQERVMDSNAIERERGITILAKNTAVNWGEHKINIVDTPGHADFGGEVERVLGMVDGCLLVVDAFEGPMPQTRFVLRKALEKGVRPILVLNKIDRPNADSDRAYDKVIDLFIELGASEEQLDFPVVYASGLNGWASLKHDEAGKNLTPLFETILRTIPAPLGSVSLPLQLQVTTIDYSEYLGRIVIGRIHHGAIRAGETIAKVGVDGTLVKGKVSKLFGFEGLKRIEIEMAAAGDIVAVAGFADANIGDTLACAEAPQALPIIRVDEPTIQMTISVNDSPFAGLEGKYVTSRQLRARLFKELESNVSLRVDETDSPDRFLVSGRGELHLGILMENMRREGYEFQVSKPKVILKEHEGRQFEPYELLVLDVPEAMVGAAMELLGHRKADMQNMQADGRGRTFIEFLIPARGLFGYRSEFIRATKGAGIMYHAFHDYLPWGGDIPYHRNGVLTAFEEGVATAYALQGLEDRGSFFIEPGAKVYKGMVVGENNRVQDMAINVCKTKKLTNMRAAGAEELVRLTPPIQMGLEKALEYISEDELVEVTPGGIRLRKQKV